MKRGFLEIIATCASGKSHFIDVSLVYWKAFTRHRAEFLINTASSLLRQHGANKNERATSSALMAFPFSRCELSLNILFSEINKIKSSELTHPMDHEMEFLSYLDWSMLGLFEQYISKPVTYQATITKIYLEAECGICVPADACFG